MENFHLKNLTKRTKDILFTIEHLIHLIKKEKKRILIFLCLNFFMCMIKKLMFNK
jgi:hypothetical protein